MNSAPLAILITSSSIKSGESDTLSELFEIGLQRLHLRKPHARPIEVAKLLDSIPSTYHNRIVLHRFPELLKDFTLAGYHFHSEEKLLEIDGTRSRSLHILSELQNVEEPIDYCFFGPVYESISKKGYIPKVSLPELGKILFSLKKKKPNSPLVYALGGVRRRKVPELFNLGFDGVTLLGSIWGKRDPVAAFERYQFIERSVWAKKEKENGLLARLLAKEED
jgi:thiamine-phosphate pyrophosphorylase